MKKRITLFTALFALIMTSCATKEQVNHKATHVNHPEWSRNAVMYEVNLRQYTEEGTIKAFEAHLPRLKELGVDILWFMPVHPISEVNRKGTLGSYYAIQNYKEINPEFGTLEEFKELVQKAHNMGFKILLDWVANHSGCDNVWMAEHPDWYVKDSLGNFTAPYDWTDTYKLDYTNPQMREGMIDALKFWVSECNIDGYRCDVAYEVPTDFWNTARKELDKIKPVFMLAEAEHAELLVDAFDMCYNWPLKNVINEIAMEKGAKKPEFAHEANGDTHAKNALDIDKLFAHQDSIFPIDSYLMNQITNHDLNSWEGTEFDRLGLGVNAFAVLTYTIPGMPLIYTGQETGMDRAFKFFEKDAAPNWDKNDWFAFYQKLNEIKHNEEALAAGVKGGEMVRYSTESPDTYIFSRSKNHSSVVVYLNLSGNQTEVKFIDQQPSGNYINAFTGEAEEFPTTMAPWEYKVYTLNSSL